MVRKRTKGWRNHNRTGNSPKRESQRHALASKGIRTRRQNPDGIVSFAKGVAGAVRTGLGVVKRFKSRKEVVKDLRSEFESIGEDFDALSTEEQQFLIDERTTRGLKEEREVAEVRAEQEKEISELRGEIDETESELEDKQAQEDEFQQEEEDAERLLESKRELHGVQTDLQVARTEKKIAETERDLEMIEAERDRQEDGGGDGIFGGMFSPPEEEKGRGRGGDGGGFNLFEQFTPPEKSRRRRK
ncbi:MAG TPA: hypothetical protein ENI23_15740 [bacterium]|nr:hypothetical protein [bacterium]